MLQHQMIKHFLGTFRHVNSGAIRITMPDGKSYDISGNQSGPLADITLHDMRAIRACAQKGDVGFAEGYHNGWWDSENLTNLFLFGLCNEDALDQYIYGNFLARLATRFAYFFQRNTLSGSKKNIHAHYDLGNDFYQLWLDASMTYSSALFANETDDLQDAQYRKYDRIIERLHTSGSLLEIGCGWGGFAERALGKRDYTIKGLTLSEAQYSFAQKRLRGKADIALEDYRLQKATYDHIVSIEMFEAVGERFWPTYFNQIKACLADKGKAIIQTIMINDDYFERYRKGGDAIRTFIFPGGMLPSQQRFVEASKTAGLAVTDQFAFGKDYALTLKHWLNRFEQQSDKVRALGFDEKFIRIWRFYLSFCIASFTAGRTDVMQIELQHSA